MSYSRVKLINDEFRTARMNEEYYARRLTTMKTLWRRIEVLIALTASGTVASWTIWTDGPGTLVWQLLSGLVAILAVFKSVVRPDREIDKLAELRAKYVNLRWDLGALVRDLAADTRLTGEQWDRFKKIMERCRELQVADDPFPDRTLLKECQAQVASEWPTSRFWWPPKPKPAPAGGRV